MVDTTQSAQQGRKVTSHLIILHGLGYWQPQMWKPMTYKSWQMPAYAKPPQCSFWTLQKIYRSLVIWLFSMGWATDSPNVKISVAHKSSQIAVCAKPPYSQFLDFAKSTMYKWMAMWLIPNLGCFKNIATSSRNLPTKQALSRNLVWKITFAQNVSRMLLDIHNHPQVDGGHYTIGTARSKGH